MANNKKRKESGWDRIKKAKELKLSDEAKSMHSLFKYFKRPHSIEPSNDASHSTEPSNDASHSTEPSNGVSIPDNSCNSFCLDIAMCDKTKHDTKIKLLTSKWKPPPNFQFPLQSIGDQQRKFNPKFLNTQWLHYSPSSDAIFCSFCHLFSTSNDKRSLVTESFRDWSNITKVVNRHQESADHNLNSQRATAFLSSTQTNKSVAELLSKAYAEKLERNKYILTSILKIIHLCGRQNISLRGDSEEKSNFHAFLLSRAETDSKLKFHLNNAPGNATYTSPQIQNTLIKLIGCQLQSTLCNSVHEADF